MNLLKIRHELLVDSIYPRMPPDEVVNENMQRLTNFSISRPKKLKRIGIYMVDLLTRDLSNRQQLRTNVKVTEKCLHCLS